ncbi:MAG: phospho-N-acetylmuramoyl-pentapeptide-transferase [Peptostreptococcaceae bacterium]|nr:phospho-N-acetylmuramoyl-pentapeptide-transferase [Peptostreptococcaceae bacterium]
MEKLLIVGVASFVIAFFVGPMLIPLLQKLKFGQTIRDDGPESHLLKNGTPTMGGFVFIVSITIASILGIFLGADPIKVGFAVLSMLLFGSVGFIDDYIKVIKKQSLGLRAKQKIVLQFIFALIVAIIQLKLSDIGTSIYIPFVKTTLDIGFLYIPFIMFVVIAIVNSVNLTDGLDGLASSVTIIVGICFSVIAYRMTQDALLTFLAAVIGGCIGFLRVNRFPAKVFMGDTGSMALGGAVAAAAVIMNVELIVPILCFVYFMESVSVIIQVWYFRKTGKRFFRMAPIHHHFEKMGWHETKVVALFVVITIVMGLIGVWAI